MSKTAKIYRLDLYSAELGNLVSWHTSRRSAEKEWKQHSEERGTEDAVGPEGIEIIEIPLTRKGLVDWLNANFTTDNG
jgi:hypothetical protein